MKAQSIVSLQAIQPVDCSKADEPTLLNMCERILSAALAAEPSVEVEADDINPEVCTSSELIKIIGLCQSRELRMYFFAIFLYRESLARVTGRPFGRVEGELQ